MLSGSAVSVAVDGEATVAVGAYQLFFFIVALKNLKDRRHRALPRSAANRMGAQVMGVFSIGSSYSSVDEAASVLRIRPTDPPRHRIKGQSRVHFYCRPELPAPGCYEYVQRYFAKGIAHLLFLSTGVQTVDICRRTMLPRNSLWALEMKETRARVQRIEC